MQENIFLIQSVDSYNLIGKIDGVANELGIKQGILLQVKTDETKKHGFSALETENITSKISNSLKNIKIKGLMTIPPLSKNPNNSRRYFSLMKELLDKLQKKFNVKLEYLSMGMSDDYKIAIEEGANMVRIGRALFL